MEIELKRAVLWGKIAEKVLDHKGEPTLVDQRKLEGNIQKVDRLELGLLAGLGETGSSAERTPYLHWNRVPDRTDCGKMGPLADPEAKVVVGEEAPHWVEGLEKPRLYQSPQNEPPS